MHVVHRLLLNGLERMLWSFNRRMFFSRYVSARRLVSVHKRSGLVVGLTFFNLVMLSGLLVICTECLLLIHCVLEHDGLLHLGLMGLHLRSEVHGRLVLRSGKVEKLLIAGLLMLFGWCDPLLGLTVDLLRVGADRFSQHLRSLLVHMLCLFVHLFL